MIDTPSQILVIHPAGLGRTTLALPALRSLREHFRAARITVASSRRAAELLPLSGSADHVLSLGRWRRELISPPTIYRSAQTLTEIRRTDYDLVIELESSTEATLIRQLIRARDRIGPRPIGPAQGLRGMIDRLAAALASRPAPFTHRAHEYLKILQPLGVRPIETEPRLRVDRAALDRVEKLMEKSGVSSGELLIGIHPGAGAGRERWPVERFASIASRLIHNFDARIIVFAGPDERGIARALVKRLPSRRAIAFDAMKIPDFVSSLARLSLLVANHSGPAHVAAAVGTPVVAASTLAGPSAEDLLSKHHAHIRRERAEAIPEEEVYTAACRLLKVNRAEILRAL
jgi:ADP-heptose:LPS heptosyltransferase